MNAGRFVFLVKFLGAMTPSMTQSDLELFEAVCRRSVEGTATPDDLSKLELLYFKFGVSKEA